MTPAICQPYGQAHETHGALSAATTIATTVCSCHTISQLPTLPHKPPGTAPAIPHCWFYPLCPPPPCFDPPSHPMPVHIVKMGCHLQGIPPTKPIIRTTSPVRHNMPPVNKGPPSGHTTQFHLPCLHCCHENSPQEHGTHPYGHHHRCHHYWLQPSHSHHHPHVFCAHHTFVPLPLASSFWRGF